jgi:glycine cleavage system aminomethyltransferase T
VGWVESAAAVAGTELEVQILQQRYPAVVAADPIYDAIDAKLLS